MQGLTSSPLLPVGGNKGQFTTKVVVVIWYYDNPMHLRVYC